MTPFPDMFLSGASFGLSFVPLAFLIGAVIGGAVAIRRLRRRIDALETRIDIGLSINRADVAAVYVAAMEARADLESVRAGTARVLGRMGLAP